jgi:ankyrin repeat protein
LNHKKNFNINCTDTFGNTGLHLASIQNQYQAAVLLIQKGINTVIKNKKLATPLDLAKTDEMKEILGFLPNTNSANANGQDFEGILYKKIRFFGFKEYFVVLNKGSIIYYSNR